MATRSSGAISTQRETADIRSGIGFLFLNADASVTLRLKRQPHCTAPVGVFGIAMAEVLASFSMPVTDEFGSYYPRAVGRLASDDMWEGWIEFVAADGWSDVLVTAVESRQPERQHLVYWAPGLRYV